MAPGTLVWTDKHKSYEWLSREGMYRHQSVNHKKGEWVGREGQSTNAIEGMWSRAKRALRVANTRKPVDNDYGPLLGEFARRMRYVRGKDWRKVAFQEAINLVANEHGIAFQRDLWAGAGFSCSGSPSLLGR